jgi:urease accessory protein
MIRRIFILSAGLFWTGIASAHGTVAAGETFLQNLLHPFSGLDHLLVMFAVGLWATRQRSLTTAALLPLVFVAAIPAGQLLGPITSLQPVLEIFVTASVLVFGLILFLELPLRLPVILPLVTATGALHGLAHVTELGIASPTSVIAMMTGTALLHSLGMIAGVWTRSAGLTGFYRMTGAGLIIAGTGLAVVVV